jgi:hypothetical protein
MLERIQHIHNFNRFIRYDGFYVHNSMTFLVTEFARHGDLYRYVEKRGPLMEEIGEIAPKPGV